MVNRTRFADTQIKWCLAPMRTLNKPPYNTSISIVSAGQSQIILISARSQKMMKVYLWSASFWNERKYLFFLRNQTGRSVLSCVRLCVLWQYLLIIHWPRKGHYDSVIQFPSQTYSLHSPSRHWMIQFISTMDVRMIALRRLRSSSIQCYINTDHDLYSKRRHCSYRWDKRTVRRMS